MKNASLLLLPVILSVGACSHPHDAGTAGGPADDDLDTPVASSDTTSDDKAKPAPKPKRLKMKMLGQRQRIDAIKSDPLEMGEVSLEGDTLTIQVTYSGGGKEHDFALCWDGSVAESFPAQIWVHLKHDANGDSAEALITKTLRFDVSKLPNDGKYFVYVLADPGGRQTVKRGDGW